MFSDRRFFCWSYAISMIKRSFLTTFCLLDRAAAVKRELMYLMLRRYEEEMSNFLSRVHVRAVQHKFFMTEHGVTIRQGVKEQDRVHDKKLTL